MKQNKRMVSVLLSLAMLLGLSITPVSAMAAPGGEDLSQALLQEGGLTAVFENLYAEVGEPLVIVPGGGTEYTYEWSVGGTVVPDNNKNSYTPKAGDLEKMIKVKVSSGGLTAEQSMYCSRLPVVYIETDGYPAGPPSKDYIPGTMRIQGSETLSKGLYDGKITIKRRGNSTSDLPKAPYKIKLDKKTGVLGMEKSKHWVLLANYLDPSLMRNTIAYDLAGDMGRTHTETKWVDVILNGSYVGNYQLCEHVRVSKGVVDIYEWEDAASKAAEEIAEAARMSTEDASELEDFMTENLDWIETKKVTFKEQEYPVTYKKLPAVTGGFLLELSTEADENSMFRTNAGLLIMFNKPEFARTSPALFDYTKGYVQAFEDSVRAQDFYTTYQGKPTHYSELFDIDSLIDYWLVEELFSNVDFMRKSTYFHKDIDGLAQMGPVWDFDWSSGGQSNTGPIPTDQWRTLVTIDGGTTAAWYDKLIKDPYFVIKAQERYLELRPTLLEDITRNGGTIEEAQAYLKESGAANSAKWPGDFMNDSDHLKNWLTERMAWLDAQYPTEGTLMSSLGYQPDNSLKLTASDGEGKPLPADTVSPQARAKAFALAKDGQDIVLSVETGSDTVKKAAVYVNGLLHEKLDVSERKTETTIPGSVLTAAPGKKDVIQVRGLDAAEKETGSNYISILETEEVPLISIEGEIAILGEAVVGGTLKADPSKMTPDGAQVDYAWTREGETASTGDESTYRLTTADIGKTITLTVTGKGDYTGSLTAVSAVVEKETQDIPEGITATDETVAGDGGTISGVTTDMEYTLKSPEDWQDVEADPIITDPGTYLIRYRETDTKKASIAVEVTILPYEAPDKLPTPDAKFDAAAMLLTGVTEEMKYKLADDGEWMDITAAEAENGIDLSDAGLTGGSAIYVYQPGDGTTASASDVQNIKLEQHTQPTVNTIDETAQAKGAITGVDDTMEYMLMPDGDWAPIENSAATVEVEPGTYQVRVRGKDTTLASPAVTVTVKGYEAPEETTYTVTFEVDGGSPVQAVSVKKDERAIRPAAPQKSGYTFVDWYSNKELTTVYDFNTTVTSDLTLYAKWEEKSVPSSSGGGGGGGATMTDTKQNTDGSTTATVIDKKTGDTTQTTTYPNGTKIVAVRPMDGTPSIEVTLPKGIDRATVTIPTDERPGPGKVAYLLRSDGSKELIKTSIVTEEGIKLTLTESAKLEIADNSKTFRDVTAKDWFDASVQFVASREIMGGTGAESFTPGAPMSRAMLMTTLARLDGQDTGKGERWDSVGMSWAKEQGISDGTGGEQDITREQLAAMLFRYASSPKVEKNWHAKGASSYSAFPDTDRVSGWAEDAMAWAVGNGIITGADGKLDPTATATRGEVAVMLMRFVERLGNI